ncbi:MAG: FAD binding domain-containing protein [Spirochaetaceae bacterium]
MTDGPDFHSPQSLEEALDIRSRTGAIPLAGGTDLLVRHRSWTGTLPDIHEPVLFVGALSELQGVEERRDGGRRTLRVGAGVTYADLLEDPRVPELVRSSIIELAAPGLRNVATLAGNICNASPAADAVCALYALDASVEVASTEGSRTVGIEEFITGPGRTTLGPDELVVAVNIPLIEGNRVLYQKVGTRRANALSKLSICAHATVEDDTVAAIAIALGAVAPTVVRVREAEELVLFEPLSKIPGRIESVIDAFRPFVTPISDQRSTAEYRREVALGLVRRFLGERLASPGAVTSPA